MRVSCRGWRRFYFSATSELSSFAGSYADACYWGSAEELAGQFGVGVIGAVEPFAVGEDLLVQGMAWLKSPASW
jgi:hypothetical protein